MSFNISGLSVNLLISISLTLIKAFVIIMFSEFKCKVKMKHLIQSEAGEANSSLEFTCLSRTLEPLTFIVIGGFAKDSQQLYGKFCQNRFLFIFSKGPIKTDNI